MFKPLLFVIQMTFSPRIVELKIILQGTDTYLTFAKGKTSSTVFLEGICPFPPPQKKKGPFWRLDSDSSCRHWASVKAIFLRQSRSSGRQVPVVDFNKNTPSKVHCSEPVLPSCLLPKKCSREDITMAADVQE